MQIGQKKFLLTGGASLIGSHVSDLLLAQGAAEIVLFDNFSLGTPEAIQHLAADPRVRLISGDILRLPELVDAMTGIDGVFAFAGFLTLPLSQNPALGLDVNVRGMINVLDACRINRVAKIVFASSVGVYGKPDVDTVDEATPYYIDRAQPALGLYAASKMIGENLCRLYSDRYGIDFISLRYSTVYGERQHFRGVNALHIIDSYVKLKKGEAPVLPGDGSQVYDFVYVGDVARGTVMSMQSDVSGEAFLMTSGVDVPLNDIMQILRDLTGSAVMPEYRDDPSRLKTTFKKKLGYLPTKAERMLGWKPEVAIGDGIRRLVDWVDHVDQVGQVDQLKPAEPVDRVKAVGRHAA